MQQIYTIRKFIAYVWCLQHRNFREAYWYSTPSTQTTSSHERLFAGQLSSLTLRSLYANALGLQHYSINTLLYLRTVQDKYIALYKELISQLCI